MLLTDLVTLAPMCSTVTGNRGDSGVPLPLQRVVVSERWALELTSVCFYHTKISSFLSLFTIRNRRQFLSVFFFSALAGIITWVPSDSVHLVYVIVMSNHPCIPGINLLLGHLDYFSKNGVIWVYFVLSCTIIECQGLRSLWRETRELKVKQLTSDGGLSDCSFKDKKIRKAREAGKRKIRETEFSLFKITAPTHSWR